MSMVRLVPAAAGVESDGGFEQMFDRMLKGFGFRNDPLTGPSRGVQHDAADYAAYIGSSLAGIAVGFVSVYELGKLVQDMLRDR